MQDKIWQLQEAKNKFSHLVERAKKNGPQFVTKHGKEAVVILSFEDYKKMAVPKTNLLEFFQGSPLAEEKVNFDNLRQKDKPRNIEL